MNQKIADRERVLALAGLFQAVSLVRAIAHESHCLEAPMAASIESLFRFDAVDAAAVFGGIRGVTHGLEVLQQQLAGRASRDLEISRYTATVMHLERKLGRNDQLLDKIHQGIVATERQASHYHPGHDAVIAGLAEVYRGTVGSLFPRVLVRGERNHLELPRNAERVRALLLAGIRAAVLWRQLGGRRIALIFGQKAMAEMAAHLAAQVGP